VKQTQIRSHPEPRPTWAAGRIAERFFRGRQIDGPRGEK
jgi:hypothetical protein